MNYRPLEFLLSLFIVSPPVDQCMFQCPKYPYICDICKNSKSWVILKALCHQPAEIASETSLWLLMLSLQFSETFGVSSTFFKTYPTSCVSDFTDLTSISLHLSNNRLLSDHPPFLSQVFQNDIALTQIFFMQTNIFCMTGCHMLHRLALGPFCAYLFGRSLGHILTDKVINHVCLTPTTLNRSYLSSKTFLTASGIPLPLDQYPPSFKCQVTLFT